MITYEIEVSPIKSDPAGREKLWTLIDFVYKRVLKLDQERRYARYYSNLLNSFKATSVQLNFHCNGQLIEIFPTALKLDDKIVPGDPVKPIPEFDAAYDPNKLLEKLEQLAGEASR